MEQQHEELTPNQVRDREEHLAAVERLKNAKADFFTKYMLKIPKEPEEGIPSDEIPVPFPERIEHEEPIGELDEEKLKQEIDAILSEEKDHPDGQIMA